MADAGLFEGRRVELIDGEVLEITPQKHRHAQCVTRLDTILRQAFAEHWVRVQMPLALGERSHPEPDLSVVAGSLDDYKDHPTTALLVVEVSDTTLSSDRGRKAGLYAGSGVGEYWIVNLIDNVLEVYRKPMRDASHEFGWRYGESQVLSTDDRVTPLSAPGVGVTVRNMLG